jgi:hypothetical protein
VAGDDEQAVRAAVDQWFVALNAMLNGDPKPFAELYTHGEDVTYMGAEGTYRVGWEATYADWKAQADKSCVYRKPKPGRIGDAVRQGSGVT